MSKVIAALLVASALSFTQAKPAIASAPFRAASVEDASVTALARKIYAQMRAGKVDPALLTAEMNEGLSPEKLSQVRAMFDQLGDPTNLTLSTREEIPGGTQYVYLAEFAKAQLHVKIVLTPDGKVAGYFLTP
jgi:D-alanyl-D-alanine carboxypeptidase